MRRFLSSIVLVSLFASVSQAERGGYHSRGYNRDRYIDSYSEDYYQNDYRTQINIYQPYYPQNYWPGGNSFPIQGPPRAYYRQQQNSYLYRGR